MKSEGSGNLERCREGTVVGVGRQAAESDRTDATSRLDRSEVGVSVDKVDGEGRV